MGFAAGLDRSLSELSFTNFYDCCEALDKQQDDSQVASTMYSNEVSQV